jgi:molecular chaperone GrpE
MDYPNDRIGDEAFTRGGAGDAERPRAADEEEGDGAAAAVEQGGAEAAAELRRQLDEQRERYLRLAAEYDNFRKRSARERQEAGARGQADLVKQLLDALDDLARFAHVDPASVDAGTVVQGAEMVEKKLLKALSAAGLETINPVDQTFDPSLHEAVSTEPALAEEDDHVIARVFQQGYRFNGLLLRPARVAVKQWNG